MRLLLGVSGSVAAIKLEELHSKLSQSFEVRIVATDAARNFFRKDWDPGCPVYSDQDDWRSWSKVGDTVLHIELKKWADILLIAPLSANTLAKIASGICDNLLTCIVRAWDPTAGSLILAPAMNTMMYENPFTERHLGTVREVYRAIIINPVEKTLACGDVGIGAMAHVDNIVDVVGKQVRLQVDSGNGAGR